MLVVGHIEATKLRMFLSEFFHPDRRSTHEHGALYQVIITSSRTAPRPSSKLGQASHTAMMQPSLVGLLLNVAIVCKY